MAQRCSSVLRGLTRGFRLGPWNLDETRLNACFFSAGQMLGGGGCKARTLFGLARPSNPRTWSFVR